MPQKQWIREKLIQQAEENIALFQKEIWFVAVEGNEWMELKFNTLGGKTPRKAWKQTIIQEWIERAEFQSSLITGNTPLPNFLNK